MARLLVLLAVMLALAPVLTAADGPGPAAAAPGANFMPPSPPAKPSGQGGQVTMSWDEFIKITGHDPALRAQTLTVPWPEVQKLLGIQVDNVGAGTLVDLPWPEFKSLLEWSLTHKGAEPQVPPPTDFVVTSCQYTGTVTGEPPKTINWSLKLKVDVLRRDGWKTIPVLPPQVAVTNAKLPEGALLKFDAKSYNVLTDKSGPMEFTFDVVWSVDINGGINHTSISSVTQASSVVDVTIDGDFSVKVWNAPAVTTTFADGKTHVLAAVPAPWGAELWWEKKLPKLPPEPTKIYSETNTLALVGEGTLLCTELVNLNILHTGVRELKLQAPAACSILEVTGKDVQEWRNDKGLITVMLNREMTGPVALRINYEQTANDAPAVPVIQPQGIERQVGYVAVGALSNVEITPAELTGAGAIDVRQLPPDLQALTPQPILLAFRLADPKASIALAIKHHEAVPVLVTVVDSSLFTSMQLRDGRRMTKVVYTVRNNRNQFLRLAMPPGADVWSASVGGNTVAPAKDEKGELLVPLIRSAGARELAGFPVELVYVETPAKTPPPEGRLRVELPRTDAPVIHVMFNYYLPAEGDYTVSTGLFSKGLGFSGPLHVVSEFAKLASGASDNAVMQQSQQQAEELQKQADVKADADAKAAGLQPIRVTLPVQGRLFKLEKILSLPGDELWLEVQYSNWK